MSLILVAMVDATPGKGNVTKGPACSVNQPGITNTNQSTELPDVSFVILYIYIFFFLECHSYY